MSRLGTLKAMMTLQFVGSALPCKICINFPTLMTTLIYTFFTFLKLQNTISLFHWPILASSFFLTFRTLQKCSLIWQKKRERKGNKPKNHY